MPTSWALFERQGLEVEIRREVSWANVRDKLALGRARRRRTSWRRCRSRLTLGIDSVNVPMINAMTLQVNGNAITLSNALWREIEEVAPEFVGERPTRRSMPAPSPPSFAIARGRGAPPLVLASVFPYSSQNYLLRLWLASGGLDPDRDVRLTVVPPPHIVAHLSGGVIDGYCVGEPWNQQAVVARHRPHRAHRPRHLEGHAGEGAGHHRSLGAANNPKTLIALVKALIEACAWLDEPANRAEAARVLSSPRYLNMPAEVIVAHARAAGLPYLPSPRTPTSRGAAMPTGSWRRWCAGGRRRADPTSAPSPTASIRTDIYRAAAARWACRAPTDRLPRGRARRSVDPADQRRVRSRWDRTSSSTDRYSIQQ